ncbi:DoxX family protein [Williamsia sterculiae]|nr:hypothetical protein [Williamsia sterculiae]
MLATVGTLHFVVPERFDETIPDEIPVDKRTATLASGVVEVGLAGGLLWPRTRRVSGLASVGLFIAVYPANLNMVRMYWHKPAVRAAMLARLPLQIPMIVAGWQVWKRAS